MSADSPQPSSDTTHVSRRHGARRALIGLAVVATSILAAWAAHELWLSEHPDGAPPAAGDLMRHDPHADRGRRSPQSLVTDPLAEVGMEVLTDANAPLTPPEGLTRTFAMRSSDGARTFQYTGQLTEGEAAEHYRTQLARAGYKPVRDARMKRGGRILVAEKGGGTLEVTLRNRDGKKKIQVYVIARPAEAGSQR